MAFIDFTAGEVLTAAQMDTTFRQTVMRFADASTRDTALTGVLSEGMIVYIDDTNEVLKYDGTSWIDISGDITGITAGTALSGGGTSGNVTLDVDESALTIAQSQVTDLVSDLADKQDDVITTEGDLVIGDASGDPVRLPVGSADQVLTSDGTTMTWEDAAGGGETLLSTTSMAGSSDIQITSIDQSYKDLKIVIKGFYAGNTNSQLSIRPFDDATTLFGRMAGQEETTNEIESTSGINFISITNDSTEGSQSIITLVISNYASTDPKPISVISSFYDSTGEHTARFLFGGFRTPNPLNKIQIIEQATATNFAGGTIEIYGV